MISVNNLVKNCKKSNFKITPQRLAIFKILASKKGEHTTAEKVFEEVIAEHPYISFNTVYTTLKMLVELDEIKELYVNKDRTYYDMNTKPHLHIVCRNCNKIKDIFIDIPDINLPPEIKDEFDLDSYQIHFFGTCKSCLN